MTIFIQAKQKLYRFRFVSPGVLMNRKIFYFSLLSIAVSSCGNLNNKQAMGDFEYAKKQEAKALEIPSGLDKPAEKSTYFISNKINHDGPIGGNVDVRAPSLVLPIAASSRAETNSSAAKIWFDQVLEETDLKTFIVDAIKAQLDNDGVTYTAVGDDKNVYESDWYHDETEEGIWLFKSVETSESIRFKFSLESKTHGRSVALKVDMLDYMKTDKTGGSKNIDPIDQQRVEMAMLNEVVSQVDFQYRLKQRENRLLRANQKFVSIGENEKSEPAYIVEISTDLLWSNLPIFFEDYGFTITDLNESDKIYFVDFVKPDSSFWDSIWGEEVPVIELANAKYQFKLQERDKKTTVTIMNENGDVLSKELLEKIFPVMEPGLSFKSVF
jgi:outer membrane protein assembly factor BamC